MLRTELSGLASVDLEAAGLARCHHDQRPADAEIQMDPVPVCGARVGVEDESCSAEVGAGLCLLI